jgi:hypothetical protein
VRRARLGRRGKLAAGAGLVAALVAGLVVGTRALPDRGPASSAVLNRIAARNQEAATTAAAHMKSQSELAASATDARLRAQDEVREQTAQNDAASE